MTVKKLLFFLFLLTSFGLTSCLDTVEELTINKDGTGTYKTTMDMSGAFDMLDMVAAMDTSNKMKKFAERDIDSTLAFSSLIDSAKDVTAEQKALLKNATLGLTLKKKERILRMNMNFPFNHVEDVQKIQGFSNMGTGLNKLAGAGDNKSQVNMEDEAVPSTTSVYNTQFKAGLLERTVDQARFEALKNGKMKDLQNAGDMLETMKFSTVINLPSIAKKVTGQRAILSKDQKTVTINYTMAEFMSNPKALEFHIEY
jgi:hypothetical protein